MGEQGTTLPAQERYKSGSATLDFSCWQALRNNWLTVPYLPPPPCHDHHPPHHPQTPAKTRLHHHLRLSCFPDFQIVQMMLEAAACHACKAMCGKLSYTIGFFVTLYAFLCNHVVCLLCCLFAEHAWQSELGQQDTNMNIRSVRHQHCRFPKGQHASWCKLREAAWTAVDIRHCLISEPVQHGISSP